MKKLILIIILSITLNVYSAITEPFSNEPERLYTTTILDSQLKLSLINFIYQNDYRAIGDNTSGSESATVDGHTVSVSWTVSAIAFGVFIWHITYSDGTSEDFYGSFNQAKLYAAKIAYEKALAAAEEERRSLPIEDSIAPMLCFLSIYSIYKILHFISEKRVKTV